MEAVFCREFGQHIRGDRQEAEIVEHRGLLPTMTARAESCIGSVHHRVDVTLSKSSISAAFARNNLTTPTFNIFQRKTISFKYSVRDESAGAYTSAKFRVRGVNTKWKLPFLDLLDRSYTGFIGNRYGMPIRMTYRRDRSQILYWLTLIHPDTTVRPRNLIASIHAKVCFAAGDELQPILSLRPRELNLESIMG